MPDIQYRYQLGAAQMNCQLADVEANLATHRELIEDGHERGLDVLAFPELSLTGYDLRSRVSEKAGTVQIAIPSITLN